MFRQLCWSMLAFAPALSAADKPNPDILALQRDVAILQELVKTMQNGLTERFSALQTQVKVSVDAAKEAVNAVAAAQRGIQQSIQAQENKLLAPVTGVGARIDSVSGDLRTVQQAVAELTSAIGKLQTQMSDLNNAVRAMQSPVGPPAPAPPSSANDLFTSAEGDRLQGKLDLALQEYAEFLKWYADSAQAHQAQYQIAQIYYAQKEYEAALKEFDALIQKYPDTSKMPEALYYKGMTLRELGRANQAADTLGELRKRFPTHTLARQAASPRRN